MSNRLQQGKKNIFKYNGEPIKITLGTLVMTCLCVLLIIIATFTQLNVKHLFFPSDTFTFLSEPFTKQEFIHHFVKSYKYIPQIPIIFFIVALMGRRFGILAIISFIALGLFFPIFALGGGINYLFEYGCGYILAFIPAAFFAGTILKDNTDFLRIIITSVIGACIIHVLGILYMFFIATLTHAPIDFIKSWILSQSSVQILYDIFFTIVSIILGKQLRKIFWLIMC